MRACTMLIGRKRSRRLFNYSDTERVDIAAVIYPSCLCRVVVYQVSITQQ